MCVMFFFFQAEDGIRYLVRSRGLGDVYKRQPRLLLDGVAKGTNQVGAQDANVIAEDFGVDRVVAVSYTHLTLPTSDLV